jgi:hypothetical protein
VRSVTRCLFRIMVPMASEMEPPRTRAWPTAPWAAAVRCQHRPKKKGGGVGRWR